MRDSTRGVRRVGSGRGVGGGLKPAVGLLEMVTLQSNPLSSATAADAMEHKASNP